MLTVILTHHPLVLVSSSGARRRFWSLCGLVDWTQRQAGRRGRHPPMNWEGSWGWAHWWRVKETEEIMRVYQGNYTTGSNEEDSKSQSHNSMNYASVSFIQLRLWSQPFRVLVDWLSWHCHVLFIWFQWSDSAHAGTSVQLRWGRVNHTVGGG